jgi:hypothetical protein
MKRQLVKRVRIEEIFLTLPPDMKTAKLRIDYSFDMSGHDWNIGDLFDALLPKCPGRPALPKKFDILDDVAQAKAMGRPYSHVGRKYGKSDKHVRDLVRNNKPYVLKKQAELSAANKSK